MKDLSPCTTKRGPKGLSAEVKRQIIALRKQGHKRKEIAQTLGLTISQVIHAVRGIPRGETEIEREIKLLHLSGVRSTEIAAKVGLTPSGISNAIRRMGLPKNRYYEDLTDKKIDSWLVLSLFDDTNPRKVKWWCRCLDCGKEKPLDHGNLIKRLTKRCRSCSAKRWQRSRNSNSSQEVSA